MTLPTPRSDAAADASMAHARPFGPPVTVGTLAVVLTVALAIATGMLTALQRPLWLDEIVTQLIAGDPGGLWHGVQSGADFQPPPHYALVRLVQGISGVTTPASARWPSALAALLSIGLLGAALRSSLSVAAALTGALALAAHPLFLAQAVEARPYALWILATLLTALAVNDPRTARSWRLAAASALLCSVHYFGVLSLAATGLVAIMSGRVRREPLSRTIRAVLPLTGGIASLGVLLPLALVQLRAIGGRSWVPPATVQHLVDFLAFPWGWRPAALLISAGAITFAIGRLPLARSWRWLPPHRPSWNPGLMALLATALVPLLVVGVSVAYKPVLVLRYAAPATLAVAVAVAFAVEALPALIRWLAVLLLARAAVFSFSSTAAAAQQRATLLATEQRVVQQLRTRGIATISPFRHEAYGASAAGRGGAVAWVELPDSVLERAAQAPGTALTRNFLLVERDFGRTIRREFSFPTTVSLEAARTASAVALLRDPMHAAADSIWLPGRQACPLSDRLSVFTLPLAPVTCAMLREEIQARARR